MSVETGPTDSADRLSELVSRHVGLRGLTVATIADVLDRLGYRNQVMHSRMRPVAAVRPILGPAFTLQAVPQPSLVSDPYALEMEATDVMPDGAVIAVSAGGASQAGLWGELLSTRALARGGVGAVIDGGVRDIAGIEQLRFPTFASTIHAADSYGRAEVTSFDEPIICGDVPVRPGDLIAADLDGVVVIPIEIAEEAIAAAADKLAKEHDAQRMLKEGVSVRDVYQRTGVL
jgi:4-hydroxy-4-methyl-2-oxoglutarate aldolase